MKRTLPLSLLGRSSRMLACSALLLSATLPLHAQTQERDESAALPVLVTEGVSGDIDLKHRSPLLSVGVTHATPEKGPVKILASATVTNEGYSKYPIRFDFYVNRTLLSTQMSSVELPGPVGIDVSRTQAQLPFNYSVVATVITPNRDFSTVLHGAVFAASQKSGVSSCTYSVNSADGTSLSLTSKEVLVSQTGNNSYTISFSGVLADPASTAAGEKPADTEPATITAKIELDGTTATGTLTSSQSAEELEVTGKGTRDAETLESVTLTSKDETASLTCS